MNIRNINTFSHNWVKDQFGVVTAIPLMCEAMAIRSESTYAGTLMLQLQK